MPNPVTFFEIIGKDAEKTQRFYADLFDWKMDANNPMNYGMVDNNGEGIGGGVSGGEDMGPQVTFYVQVSDLQASLDKAEKLGGKTIMPPSEVTPGTTIAMFSDPDGNKVGLLKAN